VTRRNLAELPFVDGIGFDELKQAGFIFAASGLERDGREMFGGEDTRANAINVFLDGLG